MITQWLPGIVICLGIGLIVMLGVSGLRHRCRWQITSTHYTPPGGSGSSISTHDEALCRRFAEGCTHIYYRCPKCGKVLEDTVYGEFKPAMPPRPADSELSALRRMAGIE